MTRRQGAQSDKRSPFLTVSHNHASLIITSNLRAQTPLKEKTERSQTTSFLLLGLDHTGETQRISAFRYIENIAILQKSRINPTGYVFAHAKTEKQIKKSLLSPLQI